ncbi:MAG: hypothetical protein RBR35_16430 [Salinivirgaceae bacterium]|nr:hypothetical protein [Salinivirgaceae bacterium]
MNQLDPNSRDRLVSIAKGVAGALPFIGSAVSEIMGSVIPNLRFERVVIFLKTLEEKIGGIDERLKSFEKNLQTEEGIDLLEEGIIQASRAVSEERKQRLARLVGRALSEEELNHQEGRKLLNIYRELTDQEIVWLIYYSLNPVLGKGPHTDWVEKHPEILMPISREMGAPSEQHERGALQDSYKSTLMQLGLTTERNRTISLTTLGQMLVRYITDEAQDKS